MKKPFHKRRFLIQKLSFFTFNGIKLHVLKSTGSCFFPFLGGISALKVFNSMLRCRVNEEMAEFGASVLAQVMTWKDQMDDLLLCEW